MATQDTVQLGETHAPQQASIDAFNAVLESLKHELKHLRHNHDKHEPEYFQRVKHVSDHDLVAFSAKDLESVRVATSAYGLHLFGKVKLHTVDDAYIHVRIFGSAKEGTDGSNPDEREYKLHSILTEDKVKADGDHVFRAIFGKADPLEFFET